MFFKQKPQQLDNNEAWQHANPDRARYLAFGFGGQLGNAFNTVIDDGLVLLGREQADFSNPESLRELVLSFEPSSILNATAYTAVDKAESEEKLATTINGEAPRVLAEVAKELDIPLVHISTDYVFDGSKDTPYNEDDIAAPINAYGRSKLAGEQAIAEVGGKYLIFRTSWVYDAYGENFFRKMIELGNRHKTLKVVSDQIGSPTYATHLAESILESLDNAMLSEPFPAGIYHLCGGGETSWHGFAESIFAGAKERGASLRVQQVEAISSSEYPTPAPRPLNSRLNCSRVNNLLGVQLPNWQDGLAEALGSLPISELEK